MTDGGRSGSQEHWGERVEGFALTRQAKGGVTCVEERQELDIRWLLAS
jgi:hypothetical protein